jgi:hypothetical protein
LLPPEIRDAAAGGLFEKVPARYRALLERYRKWVQQQDPATTR